MAAKYKNKKKHYYIGAAITAVIMLGTYFSGTPDYDSLSSIEGHVFATHFVDTRYDDYWLIELREKPLIDGIRLPRVKNLPRINAGDHIVAKVYDDHSHQQPEVWQISVNRKMLFSYDDFVSVSATFKRKFILIMSVVLSVFLLLGFIKRE